MIFRFFSLKGIVFILASVLIMLGMINYVGAAGTGTTTKPVPKKITCTAGSEPNARGTKCVACTPGNVSSNGLSCRACRGENIASTSGANACIPCAAGSKANKAHTACIKQKFVSGEKK